MAERDSQEWHDKRAEKLTDSVEGIGELLEQFPEPEQRESAGPMTNFYLRKTAEYLLGNRNRKENLVRNKDDGSWFVKVTGDENKWINFYKRGKDILGIRTASINRSNGGEIIFDDAKPFEFRKSDLVAVRYSMVSTRGDIARAVYLRIRKESSVVSYIVFDNGFMGPNDPT